MFIKICSSFISFDTRSFMYLFFSQVTVLLLNQCYRSDWIPKVALLKGCCLVLFSSSPLPLELCHFNPWISELNVCTHFLALQFKHPWQVVLDSLCSKCAAQNASSRLICVILSRSFFCDLLWNLTHIGYRWLSPLSRSSASSANDAKLVDGVQGGNDVWTQRGLKCRDHRQRKYFIRNRCTVFMKMCPLLLWTY